MGWDGQGKSTAAIFEVMGETTGSGHSQHVFPPSELFILSYAKSRSVAIERRCKPEIYKSRFMSDLGFTPIALPVRSLDASVEFYGLFANMQVVHSRPGVAWISDRTRPFVIVLIETAVAIRPLLPEAHLGVAVASREEVDRLCAIARSESCLVSEPQELGPPVGYFAYLRNPDGHTLELAFGQNVGLVVERSR